MRRAGAPTAEGTGHDRPTAQALVSRPVFLPRPRVRVDLEAAVKRSADRARVGVRVGVVVVVFDSFDEQMTIYALDDVPSVEVFFRLEDVLRIAGDQRGRVDLVHESPHKRIIA